MQELAARERITEAALRAYGGLGSIRAICNYDGQKLLKAKNGESMLKILDVKLCRHVFKRWKSHCEAAHHKFFDGSDFSVDLEMSLGSNSEGEALEGREDELPQMDKRWPTSSDILAFDSTSHFLF